MPLEEPARLARVLASHGFTADREAITLLAGTEDPESALRVAVEAAPEDELKLSAAAVRDALEAGPRGRRDPISDGAATPAGSPGGAAVTAHGNDSPNPSVSGGDGGVRRPSDGGGAPVETGGSGGPVGGGGRNVDPSLREIGRAHV